MSQTIDYGTVNFDGVTYTLTSEATHACRPGSNVWVAWAEGPDGLRYIVEWDFTDEEMTAAGEDASSLPWDDDHVSRVRCVS